MTNLLPASQDGAGYIRVSTDKQEELSPDAQKRLLLDYAKKNNISISSQDIFVENGISGRKADKRPAFQEMIAKAKSKEHPYDVILVWKFSRFARNQEESIVYKSMLKKDNVEVVSVSEPLVDGPFGSLIERIIEWMDEYYSIRLSGEVMRGMTEKAMRGGYQAAAPIGYDHKKGEIPTVNPDTAQIVRLIFDLYVNHGMDFSAIARDLNDRGYTSKRGGKFELRTVQYILQNPFYIGKVRWNRAPHSAYRENPKENIIIVTGQHEPIISDELFVKAAERIQNEFTPASRRSTAYAKHWLSGMLKCNFCGATLAYNRNSRWGSFQCHRYSKGMHEKSCSISETKITKEIIDTLKDVLRTDQISFSYLPPADKNKDSILPMTKELDKIKIRLKRVKAAYENGIDTLEEYRENKASILKEQASIEERIAELKQNTNIIELDLKSVMLERCHNVIEVIESDVDHATKSAAIRSIIEKIVVDKENDSIELYFYYS